MVRLYLSQSVHPKYRVGMGKGARGGENSVNQLIVPIIMRYENMILDLLVSMIRFGSR